MILTSMLGVFFAGALLISSPTMLLMASIILSILMASAILVHINLWLGYSFLLMYLGGLLIMFVYIISALSSEKVKAPFCSSAAMITSILLTFILAKSFWASKNITGPVSSMSDLYSLNNSPMLIIMTGYLVTLLMMSATLSEKFKGTHKCLL